MTLLSVVALALVGLREYARCRPEAAAEEAGLPALYVQVLHRRHHRPVRTSRDVYEAVAALGGYLSRQ